MGLFNKNPFKFLKDPTKYFVTADEIAEVEKQIETKGFWEDSREWRISTTMTCRIEPETKNNKLYYITTVECEEKTVIPAATIKRAILFKKIHTDLQIELWHSLGWASWTEKGTP